MNLFRFSSTREREKGDACRGRVKRNCLPGIHCRDGPCSRPRTGMVWRSSGCACAAWGRRKWRTSFHTRYKRGTWLPRVSTWCASEGSTDPRRSWDSSRKGTASKELRELMICAWSNKASKRILGRKLRIGVGRTRTCASSPSVHPT